MNILEKLKSNLETYKKQEQISKPRFWTHKVNYLLLFSTKNDAVDFSQSTNNAKIEGLILG